MKTTLVFVTYHRSLTLTLWNACQDESGEAVLDLAVLLSIPRIGIAATGFSGRVVVNTLLLIMFSKTGDKIVLFAKQWVKIREIFSLDSMHANI